VTDKKTRCEQKMTEKKQMRSAQESCLTRTAKVDVRDCFLEQ